MMISARSRWTITVPVLMLTLVAAHQRATAESLWDMIGRSIEDGKKKQEFCAKNPQHERCQPITASTLLIRCESSLPENLGRCHGSLMAYAQDGVEDLIEWQCVPLEVRRDTEQLRRLFLREAQRVPEVLHLQARQLLYYAVVKAFPCSLRTR